MKVGARAAPGTADNADSLTPFNRTSPFHRYFRKVTVTCYNAVPMINLQRISNIGLI